jgi:hypothetical protein
LKRRDLTKGQKAMLLARLYPDAQRAGAARRTRRQKPNKVGVFPPSDFAKLEHNQRQSGQLAGVPTQTDAAKLMNVGERSVERGGRRADSGRPVGGLIASCPASIARRPFRRSWGFLEAWNRTLILDPHHGPMAGRGRGSPERQNGDKRLSVSALEVG